MGRRGGVPWLETPVNHPAKERRVPVPVWPCPVATEATEAAVAGSAVGGSYKQRRSLNNRIQCGKLVYRVIVGTITDLVPTTDSSGGTSHTIAGPGCEVSGRPTGIYLKCCLFVPGILMMVGRRSCGKFKVTLADNSAKHP